MAEVLVRNVGDEPVEVGGVELEPGQGVSLPSEQLEEVPAGVVVYPQPVVDENGSIVLPPPDVLREYGIVLPDPESE